MALPAGARWRGREIKLIDGTGISIPDTPDLQAAFPQRGSQKPGLGFPQALVVGVISLGSGCMIDWTMTPCQGEGNRESTQLWPLLDRFAPGDVVIADRAYSSYFLLAAVQQRGIDFVIREHAVRKNRSAYSQALGPNDRCVVWSRPARPAWMDPATYASMPEALGVREVRDGNRLIATSLDDPRFWTPVLVAGPIPVAALRLSPVATARIRPTTPGTRPAPRRATAAPRRPRHTARSAWRACPCRRRWHRVPGQARG